MGEVFVIFFFGVVAVAGTVFVQTGTLETAGIMVGVQVGLYSAVLIAINNLRDQAEDERSRKFTLAVLFGQTFAEIEIAVFCLLPLFLGGIWFLLGQVWWEAMIYPLALLPLSVVIISGVWRSVPSRSLQPLPGHVRCPAGRIRDPDRPGGEMSECRTTFTGATA